MTRPPDQKTMLPEVLPDEDDVPADGPSPRARVLAIARRMVKNAGQSVVGAAAVGMVGFGCVDPLDDDDSVWFDDDDSSPDDDDAAPDDDDAAPDDDDAAPDDDDTAPDDDDSADDDDSSRDDDDSSRDDDDSSR
jgi:hypothetical protein